MKRLINTTTAIAGEDADDVGELTTEVEQTGVNEVMLQFEPTTPGSGPPVLGAYFTRTDAAILGYQLIQASEEGLEEE